MTNATFILVDMSHNQSKLGAAFNSLTNGSSLSQQVKQPKNLLNSSTTPYNNSRLQQKSNQQYNSASTTLEPLRQKTSTTNVIRISTSNNQALASLAAQLSKHTSGKGVQQRNMAPNTSVLSGNMSDSEMVQLGRRRESINEEAANNNVIIVMTQNGIESNNNKTQVKQKNFKTFKNAAVANIA